MHSSQYRPATSEFMSYASRLLILLLALFLAACGSGGMAVAPELVDPDAVTARAFGVDECTLAFAAAVPARLNPNPETATAGEEPAGDHAAAQVITLRDGSLWYQLADGMWVNVDGVEYTTSGDCRP